MSHECEQLIRFGHFVAIEGQDVGGRPASATCSPEQFDERLRARALESDDKWGPAITPATFRRGGRRLKDDVEAWHMLMLDLDGMPDEYLEDITAALPYFGWRYSTHSHGHTGDKIDSQGQVVGKKWTPGTSRLRYLIPLTRSITGTRQEITAHVAGIFEAIISRMPEGSRAFFDKATCNIAGFFFLPRRRHPDHILAPFIEKLDGPWLNPDDFEPVERERYEAPQDVDTSTIEDASYWLMSALEHHDPDLYQEWTDVGMSLYHSFGDSGFETWSEWSSRASNADDEGKLWKKWKTFARSSSSRDRTVGSIWHTAEGRGWTPPDRPVRPPRRMADPYEGLEPLDLTQARVTVRGHIFEALDRPGCTAIPAGTETGKSTSAIAAMVDRLMDNREMITLSSSSNELVLELIDRLLDQAQSSYGPAGRERLSSITAHDGARRNEEGHPHHCPQTTLYRTLASRDPEAAGRYCNGECPHHPDRDVRSPCRFVDTSRAARDGGGRAIFRTHHMQLVRRAIIDKRSPGRILAPLRRVSWSKALHVFGYINEEGRALFQDPLDHYPEARYIPVLVRRTTTLSLEVRESTHEDRTGYHAPDFEEGDIIPCQRTITRRTPTTHELEIPSFELTPQGRDKLALWAMATRGNTWCETPFLQEEGDEAAPLWQVFVNPDEWSEGSIIHDEDMLGAALPTEFIDRDTLMDLFAYGALVREDGSTPHINDEDVRTWLEAIEALTVSAPLSSLDTPLPSLREPDTLEWLDVAMEAAGHSIDKLENIPRPSQAAAWTALVARGGKGAFIMSKGLHIEIVHELLMPYYRSQIILDATPSIPALKTMLPGVQVKRVAARLHPDTYTARFDMSLPSGHDLESEERNHQHKLRWHALHDLGARAIRAQRGKGAVLLHMPRSAQMPGKFDDPSELSPQQALIHHAVCHGDLATHINSSLSRGSNDFEHCAGVIQDTYRAPRGAILARAELLHYLSGDDAVDWEAHATWSIEGAPCAQGIQRVRARGNARTLFYTSRIDYPGHEPDEVVDEPVVDACVALAYGVLPAHTKTHDGALSAAALIMHLALTCHGGTWLAGEWSTLAKKVKVTGSDDTRIKSALDAFFDVAEQGKKSTVQRLLFEEAFKTGRHLRIEKHGRSISYGGVTRSSHFALRISSKVTGSRDTPAWPHKLRSIFTSRHGANASWEAYAEMMHLSHLQPPTSLGARSPHFLYLGELDREQVMATCKKAGASWVELDGQRIELGEPRPPIGAWIVSLPSPEDVSWSALMLHLGVSQAQARRVARRDGMGTLDAMRAHWYEVHRDVGKTPTRTNTCMYLPTPEQVLYRPSRADQEATHLLRIHEDFESRRHECTQQMHEANEPISHGSCWPPEYYLELEQQLTREVYARHEASYRALVPHGPAGVLSFWPSYEQWCERLRSDKDPISWPPDDVWQTWCQRDPLLARSLETFRQEVEALFGQYWYDTLHVHREVQPYADDMKQEDEMSSHFWHDAQESFEAWVAHLRTQLDGRGASLPMVFLEALYVEQRGEECIDLKRAWIPRRLELEFPFTVAFIKWARSTDVIFADEIQTREDFTRHLRLHLTWRTNQGRAHHTVVAPTALFAAPCPFTEHDYYEEMGAWMWEVEHAERHLASFDDVDIDSMRLEWSLVDAHGIKLHTLTRSLRADAEEMRSLLAARDSSALYPEPDPDLWPF